MFQMRFDNSIGICYTGNERMDGDMQKSSDKIKASKERRKWIPILFLMLILSVACFILFGMLWLGNYGLLILIDRYVGLTIGLAVAATYMWAVEIFMISLRMSVIYG